MAYNVLKGAIRNNTLPAFSVYVNTTITDVTGDGTNYTVIYDTEVFDQDNNFNLATGIFTAPITGIYRFDFGGQIGGGTTISGATANWFINTSIGNYTLSSPLPGGAIRFTAYGAITISLNSGNTVFISVQVTDTGGKIDDVLGVSAGRILNWFSGSFVC